MDDETWMNAEKALQFGFVDGILFDEKESKMPFIPKEEPEGEEPDEGKSKGEEPEEDEPKKKNTAEAMLYSLSRSRDAFMQRVSASAEPVKGTPINQLEKRLELLKY